MVANTLQYLRRADTSSGFPLHELLHDAVFQRVIADDHQSPFKTEDFDGLLQEFFELFQFTVNGNTQRLKSPGGGMDSTVSEANHRLD